MEQEKLPNVTIALVLSILSFIGCCCTSGFGGLLFGGIALFLTNKDTKLYNENPENYSNFSQLKTAKTIAIIGLILSVLMVGAYFYLKFSGMDGALEEYLLELQEELESQQ